MLDLLTTVKWVEKGGLIIFIAETGGQLQAKTKLWRSEKQKEKR